MVRHLMFNELVAGSFRLYVLPDTVTMVVVHWAEAQAHHL